MRKLAVIFVLFAAAIGRANTYYVDLNGDGTDPNGWPGALTSFTAMMDKLVYNEIADAVIEVNDGNYSSGNYSVSAAFADKALRVHGKNADLSMLTFQASTGLWLSGCQNLNLTLNNLTARSVYESNTYAVIFSNGTGATNDGYQITIDHCNIGIKDDTRGGYTGGIMLTTNGVADPQRKLTITDSNVYSKDSGAPVHLADFNSLTITDSNCDGSNADTSLSNNKAIVVRGVIGDVNVQNNSILSKGFGLWAYIDDYTRFHSCNFQSNFVDCNGFAFYVQDYLEGGTISYNTGNGGIYLGRHDADSSHPLGHIDVNDNILIRDNLNNVSNYFGLTFAFGTISVKAHNNYVYGFGNGIIAKGRGKDIRHNSIWGGLGGGDDYAGYFRSLQDSNVIYNDFHALAGLSAVILKDQTGFYVADGNDTDRNVITNNILDSGGNSEYALCINVGSNVYNNKMDWNCYVAGTTALAVVGGGDKSLPGLRTWWSENGLGDSANNEVHSIEQDTKCYKCLRSTPARSRAGYDLGN